MRLLNLIKSLCICSFIIIAGTSHAQTSYKIPEQYREAPTVEQAALDIGYPPKMPSWAQRSGYCCMEMDIDENGIPSNVDASYCSDDIFALSSVLATKKWVFQTLSVDGKPVSWKSHMSLQTFMLADYDGTWLPDANRLLSPNPQEQPNSVEELCRAIPAS